jgi:RsiW-degrading membrane proteinase PrsW (M82 family)
MGNQAIDGALALTVALVGLAIAVHSRRAFNTARWQKLSLSSEWIWFSLMASVWVLGILLFVGLPQMVRWTFPPLIVLGAWSASLLFLSTTLRGLKSPTGREHLPDSLGPRHVVLLATTLSATFATTLSLILEGAFLVGMMTVMLATTKLLDDPSTFDLLNSAAQDPQTLQRLEEMIVRSPAALAGLVCVMVFIAPAIEELLKGLPLFLFARQKSRLSERMAILLGVASGIGFAFVENVGYLSMLIDSWWLVFWFRAGAAVMHGTASGFIGRSWYWGLKKGRWVAMLLDLCKGWGVHGSWNALALLVGWFAYREVMEGVLFCVAVGLVPLAILFTIMARWGIWVSDT